MSNATGYASRGCWLLAGALWLGACTEEAPDRTPVVRPVKIHEVTDDGGGQVREYPGAVRAATSAEMGFEVPGRIVELDAKEGAQVEAGQVLGRLDDSDYRADLDIAMANLRKSQADLTRSERVYAEDPGAITPERIDSDRRAVEVSQAQVAQAQKAVNDTVLKAPFRGVVSRRLVEVYENVQAKQPVVIVENLRAMEVEINVPERDIVNRAQNRTSADVEAATERVKPMVSISSLPDSSFPGRITEVASRADPATRTFAVRIAFEAPEGLAMLPGMTARVTARFGGAGGVTIPVAALVATPDSEPKVWVVDPETMTVTGRQIRLGAAVGDVVAVLDGLEPGEWVATTGLAQLADGMQVSRYQGAQ
ncbi:MAG: efflux RND transporter periplasmic adaptor subunit [Pseudomonadales bacterium]